MWMCDRFSGLEEKRMVRSGRVVSVKKRFAVDGEGRFRWFLSVSCVLEEGFSREVPLGRSETRGGRGCFKMFEGVVGRRWFGWSVSAGCGLLLGRRGLFFFGRRK